MNRRGFLTRASLLVGSVGLAESFKLDLLNQLGHALLPRALGSEGLPRRQLDLCFRSGIPMIVFATGSEFTSLKTPRYSNFSYAGNEIIKAPDVSNLYFNQDSQTLMKHAANIAITQGVQQEGGHRALFNFREGGLGKGQTTPIVELANENRTSSILHGVKFPGNAVNRANGMRDLINLADNDGYRALFTNPRLRMTENEVRSVLGAAEKLSRRQALLLEDRMTASLDQSMIHMKAAHMFAVDYRSLLSLDGLTTTLTKTGSYANSRESLGLALRGMQHNLINSAMAVFELGDWHGYQSNKENAAIIRDISAIIASVIDFLKATPEPVMPQLKLWDTTVIVAGSEFTRGISKFSNDNSDGGTQGMMLIGKNVRGNYYGGFTLADNSDSASGLAHGFDLRTGVTTEGRRNTTEQMHCTIRYAVGLPVAITEQEKIMRCVLS